MKFAILPSYLFLCLLLGGSSRGVWANALLQLSAVGLLVWAFLSRDPPAIQPAGRRLLLIVAVLGALFAIQLVPMPPDLWTKIPGRELVARGFDLLGMQQPWMPLSLSPYDTIAAALTLLPPLSLLIAMLRLRAWRAETMFMALLAGAATSILLGLLQVRSGTEWYFYEVTNLGVAVGAFANANHFATLLLVAIPIFSAVAIGRWRAAKDRQQRSAIFLVSAAAAAVLLVGILMCQSAAFLLLGPPVLAATILIPMRLGKTRIRQGFLAIFALIVIAAGTLVVAGDRLPGWGTSASVETRKQFWATSAAAVQGQALTGWGFGTFQEAYRRYEDAGSVDRFYVNHAHNDYLEIAVEGGVPALLLVVAFLIWWANRSREAWMSSGATIEQKAASIASAAILLHSLFDFPLRTSAITAVLAVCLALLAGARGTIRSADVEKPRHATL
nr:O-antigen ligase family protein [Sphingomonas alba]